MKANIRKQLITSLLIQSGSETEAKKIVTEYEQVIGFLKDFYHPVYLGFYLSQLKKCGITQDQWKQKNERDQSVIQTWRDKWVCWTEYIQEEDIPILMKEFLKDTQLCYTSILIPNLAKPVNRYSLFVKKKSEVYELSISDCDSEKVEFHKATVISERAEMLKDVLDVKSEERQNFRKKLLGFGIIPLCKEICHVINIYQLERDNWKEEFRAEFLRNQKEEKMAK